MINQTVTQHQIELPLNGDRFYHNLPHKPYCSNDLGFGIHPRTRDHALKHAYIQPNPPAMRFWMTFDIDHEKYLIWEDAGLPDPNIVVRNRQNRRCHPYYAVEAVCTSDAARMRPMQYMASIEQAYCKALQADACYTGLIAKNPYSSQWSTIDIHNHEFSLGELADYVDLETRYWTRKRASNDEQYGLGRNCALFHRLRHWAYDHVTWCREQGTYDEWMKLVLSRCERFNDFDQALPYGEVKSTAKSVGKWVWTKYWPDRKRVRRGVMTEYFDGLDIKPNQRGKQSEAAKRTNELQRTDTEEKIIAAIGQLTAAGKKTSMRAVAKLAGTSQQNISKHYRHLFPARK